MAPADLERIAKLLAAQEWIFARTMPENPHWYTLRRNWASDEDFVWAVEMIRRHGYRQKYGRSWYRVLEVGDHFYWTMGWPVGELTWGWDRLSKAGTILINRKPLSALPVGSASEQGTPR